VVKKPLCGITQGSCADRKYGLCWKEKECKFNDEQTYEINLPSEVLK
jgi:hypothetical protein